MVKPVEAQVIGEHIRRLRLRRHTSVRAFAAQTGFSPSFISQLENGQVTPSLGSLQKIAETLGVTLGEFFVEYGYNAYAWNESRLRIMQRIGNQEDNLRATCKLTAQHDKTVIESNICRGRYPAANVQMPDPARCK